MNAVLLTLAITAAPTHTADDLLDWVIADASQLPQEVRPLVRYIVIPPRAGEDWDRATSLILNEAVSQAPDVVLPVSTGKGYLLRVYIPDMFPSRDIIGPTRELVSQRILRLWDEISFNDFRFYEKVDDLLIAVPEYLHVQGVFTRIRGAVLASWLDQAKVRHLLSLGVHHAPLISADVFAIQAYTSVQTPVGRGRYYDFVGVNPSLKAQRDRIFASLGASILQSEKLDAQRRAGLLVSRVTHQDRIIVRGQGLVGYWWVTLDRGRNEGIRRALTFNALFRTLHKAEEIFIEKQNGLRIALASAQNGDLQTSVPDDVAFDTRTASADKRISPGFKCNACHFRFDGKEDSGYISFVNDLQGILSGNPPIIDEQSNLKSTPDQTRSKLRGQYGRALQLRADVITDRAKYALAVRRATDLNRNGGGFTPPNYTPRWNKCG